MAIESAAKITGAQLEQFDKDGFLVMPGLLSRNDVRELADAHNALYERRNVPGCFMADPNDPEPLKRYPRMMHPHRVSDVAMRYMLHPTLEPVLAALLDERPIAAQSMFYWKPPTARGQALHQDNFYLKAYPGTCLAAWVPVDRADRDSGGLFVVPGSHKMDLFCPEEADPTVSFTKEFVPVPDGLAQVPVDLEPGDVLFFGGNVIHGSESNRTSDRFRRSFICHYIGESSQEVSRFYKPLYWFDGTEVTVPDATGGGPCGTVEAKGPH